MAHRNAVLLTTTLVLAALWPVGPLAAGRGDIQPANDRDPDPSVFSTRLVARPAKLDLDGDGRSEDVWSFNGSVPGPEIRVKVGDIVRVRFKNRLPVPSTIHWHGIELTNRSDGTVLTQEEVPPGGTFRYRFRVTRPGVFWYHPHIRPSNQVFRGLYGSLIVTDRSEKKLARLGVIPRRQETLVLTDITICREPGANDEETYPTDPSLPWAGEGPFPGHAFSPTPRELCETPLTPEGQRGTSPLPAGSIPNVQSRRNCLEGDPALPCRVNVGQLVLSNGRVAGAREGSPTDPGELAADARPILIGAGEGLRLRLINASLIRYYRLLMTDADGAPVPIHRIGGEGGLLNRARLEGGMEQGLDTQFDRGEIVLGPSERTDVVVVAQGAEGDVLTLWTRDYPHTGRGFAFTPTRPVMHFRIDGTRTPPTPLALQERTRLLKDPRVDRPIERLKKQKPDSSLVDPATLVGAPLGTSSPTIRLTNVAGPSIDEIPGNFDEPAFGLDFRSIPFLRSSRFARVGGLLELEVANETAAHHVFHLHGFSFQPVRFRRGGRTVYRFKYPEFADSVDVPPDHTLVFKVRLKDRPIRPESSEPGGALGRWLLHCHILPHAALGMISELVVLPAE
jgi:FtsP/CotA-like multicopper oxidase with cupredoxin domain